MSNNVLDITPDPKVLVALTHTPLKPLDALCELIDNAIDSFLVARLEGAPEAHPMIQITVPGEAEARAGGGIVRLVDNGSGLDREGLANSLKAGFSGKNRYDSLGLFGMGFNIATGKLGQRTTVVTAKRGNAKALRVVLDLTVIQQARRFEVPVEEIEKPDQLDHGTWVEVSHWWPEGTANGGFIIQLARLAKPKLREQIGRRYATILRRTNEDRIRVRLNDEPVNGFEHCVWSSERYVERQSWGIIPAQILINRVIASHQRCKKDGALLTPESGECPECGGSEFTTVDERVHGWVGIQRFDDSDRFGIDLIRNGRAIRVGEKDAFFTYAEGLESVKEYPVDQQYGRIIGEIHLDRVPVDFGKQNFQRSSEEWIRAMDYLRGGSLLPSNWTGGYRNESPVSKLFQGYRKVRNFGRQDLYMGRYDTTQRKALRISRETEFDYYQRFLNREFGYYDDSKWWELVEGAGVREVDQLEQCPSCGYEGLPGAEICEGCDFILIGKQCVDCNETIASSSVICNKCGASQIPEVLEPWSCNVCETVNEVDVDTCSQCGSIRGVPYPASEEALRAAAEQNSYLSFTERSFALPGGRQSEPLEVEVYEVGLIQPVWNQPRVSTISFKAPGSIRIYIDTSHEDFVKLCVRPEDAVAIEAAQYLRDLNSASAGRKEYSVHNIAAIVLASVWGERLASGPYQIAEAVRSLFTKIAERLGTCDKAADFYGELDLFENRELADQLIVAGILDKLGEMKDDGAYLRYSSPSVLSRFFRFYPQSWFGSVWKRRLLDPADIGNDAADNANQQVIGVVSRCLEDCAAYIRYQENDPLIVTRVRAAKEYLEELLT
jgi:uncharacterized OB-fold protein